MFDRKYIAIIFIAFLSSCASKNDSLTNDNCAPTNTCSPKYKTLDELPLDAKFYPYDQNNHKLMLQLTAPKEYNGMKFLSFNLVWIPKNPVAIERFQYERGVPVHFWEPSEKKGSVFSMLNIPTTEAENMVVDIVYMKHVCDRYVYRLAIKHHQTTKPGDP